MQLKNLFLRLKIIRLKCFVMRNVKRKSRKVENGKRMAAYVSHGYHVVELRQTWATPQNLTNLDHVLVQRQESKDCELWFFSLFNDDVAAHEITNCMNSTFFNNLPKESKMVKKSKEAMKRAHEKARSKTIERDEGDAPVLKSSSASAMMINGEWVVMASSGGYEAVICRDGEAYQIGRKRQRQHKSLESSEVRVGAERVDSQTEFLILASSGVWEVMKQQEAVNLIRHIEDAEAAAECLATEALKRRTKTTVSCIIIRFH